MGAAVHLVQPRERDEAGSAASVPLADAREKAASARRKIAEGLNPIDERKRDGGIPTFMMSPGQCSAVVSGRFPSGRQ